MDDIRHILVVSRMTAYCKKAVRYGVSLARKYHAALSVIHVMHNPLRSNGTFPFRP
jgi:nucleotide-binding universal stress UspA family protein